MRKVILLCLFLSLFLSFPSLADNINLELTYGYEDTAKAGRFLPLRIDMENTMSSTFTGYVHVYLAESGSSMFEYRYPSLVEAESESSLTVTLALSAGVNQLLVTAEGRDGRVYGSKRIGLDVTASDAELIIGLLSEQVGNLSYFNGVSLNNGLLRTKTVSLNPERLPQDELEMDQLDVILISDYVLSSMKSGEAAALNRWVEKGGVLLLGTGERGESALSPYFSELLRNTPEPRESAVDMGEGAMQTLMLSPIYLNGGRELKSSEGIPILSEISRGSGVISVSGYDFCDLQRYGTEHPDYVDRLLTELLGEQRIDSLSISATERGLKRYWNMEALMNRSDISKLPRLSLYLLILGIYVLLIGPGLRLFLRYHEAPLMYRPAALLLSGLFSILVFIMGMDTRFSGSFLNYVKWKDYTAEYIDETDYINIRSPYREEYGIPIKTEYSVYPFLKGTDYTGDISELRGEEGVSHTGIEYLREHTEIRVEGEKPFTSKYFELHNKIPNREGSFTGELHYFHGKLSGTVTNETSHTLYDAAILLYGRLIRIGKIESMQSIDLSAFHVETVPVWNPEWTASRVSSGNSRELLHYYLSIQPGGYFSQAKLLGFFHDELMGFTEESRMESYGVTLALATLPVTEAEGGLLELPALRRDPVVESGDYENNSISPLTPVTLSYPLGEEEIRSIRFEGLQLPMGITEESFHLLPFQGAVSLYNYQSGGFDSIDYRSRELSGEDLRRYLSPGNILRIRFTPKEEGYSAFTRFYLPTPIVTMQESVVQEIAAPTASENEGASPEDAAELSGNGGEEAE